MVQDCKQNIPPDNYCLYQAFVFSNSHDNFSRRYKELYEDKKRRLEIVPHAGGV
jgi:hypothetical protein